MERVSNIKLPKIAYVFGDLTGGGHNLQAFKTILYSGAVDNCIAVSLSHDQDNRLESMLKNYGIKVYYCDTKKGGLLSIIVALRRIILTNKCKIAHSNGLRADLACHYALNKTSVKHIITLHNYLKEDAYLRMNKIKATVAVMMQAHLLKQCEHVIACSKTLELQMVTDYPELRLYTIQNGVDADIYCRKNRNELRKKYNISLDKTIFISTGRMSTRKRIGETANAFLNAHLDQHYELWFVGNGEKFDEYRSKYSCDNVKFLGRRDDIPSLLNIADAFVSSSESEGLPLAVLEALACGIPVILSDIPQHKEILEEIPEAGSLYPLGLENELSESFSRFDPHNTPRIRPLQDTCFDIKIMGYKYAQYYLSLVGTIL